jgi:uncharacterized protein (TIGR01244 family)
MDIRPISETFAVSPQIAPEDVAEIKAAGFATVVCNRPDVEIPPEVQADAIRAAVEAAGLRFVMNPLSHGSLSMDHVETQGRALTGSDGPVFAYCASGNRSAILWALSQAGAVPTDDLIAAASPRGLQPRAGAAADRPARAGLKPHSGKGGRPGSGGRALQVGRRQPISGRRGDGHRRSGGPAGIGRFGLGGPEVESAGQPAPGCDRAWRITAPGGRMRTARLPPLCPRWAAAIKRPSGASRRMLRTESPASGRMCRAQGSGPSQAARSCGPARRPSRSRPAAGPPGASLGPEDAFGARGREKQPQDAGPLPAAKVDLEPRLAVGAFLELEQRGAEVGKRGTGEGRHSFAARVPDGGEPVVEHMPEERRVHRRRRPRIDPACADGPGRLHLDEGNPKHGVQYRETGALSARLQREKQGVDPRPRRCRAGRSRCSVRIRRAQAPDRDDPPPRAAGHAARCRPHRRAAVGRPRRAAGAREDGDAERRPARVLPVCFAASRTGG